MIEYGNNEREWKRNHKSKIELKSKWKEKKKTTPNDNNPEHKSNGTTKIYCIGMVKTEKQTNIIVIKSINS